MKRPTGRIADLFSVEMGREPVTADYRREIRRIAASKDVRYLLHFTQAANLADIVAHGLLSRRDQAARGHVGYASDHFRLDEKYDAISVSMSRVNAALLASKRIKSEHRDWLVLVLPADILWTHDCRFCWSSAATKEIKEHRGWRGGPWAFGRMFHGSAPNRSGIPPFWPTDPEAEVQVLEPIGPEYLLGAIVDREEMVKPVEEILNVPRGQLPVVVEAF